LKTTIFSFFIDKRPLENDHTSNIFVADMHAIFHFLTLYQR